MRNIFFLIALFFTATSNAQSSFSIPNSYITLDALDSYRAERMSSDLLNESLMENLSCFGNEPTPLPYQWLHWTMPQPGQFKFEITPLNGTDDLDFVLFVQAGNELIPLRKMTAGATLNSAISLQCIGSTGLLDANESTINTSCVSNNNYLKPLDAVDGADYFLLITNATSYNGFTIDFSGNASSPEINPDENYGIDNIFPNPTDNWVNIKINAKNAALGTFSVMDMSGKTMHTTPLNISKGSQIIQIDLSDIPNGQIICKIVLESQTAIQHITKY